MKQYIMKLLECPSCHGELSWNITKKSKDEIEEAQAACIKCSSTFPVHEGIALFIKQKLAESDPWETADGQLTRTFKQHPQLEYELLNAAIEKASPNDLFLKALLLEEQGRLLEGKCVYESAQTGFYTKETIDSMNSQFDYVIKNIGDVKEPIIDIASGRCLFAEQLLLKTDNPIIITDFSPRILKRNRDYFKLTEMYDRVSLIAVDARCTPFKSKSVKTLTSFMMLPNIENPEGLLQELKRVAAGNYFFIHAFYPDDGSKNARIIKKNNLDKFCFKKSAMDYFQSAKLPVYIRNILQTYEKPPEPGKIIHGAIVNAIPASEVTSEWCTLTNI